MLFRRFYRSPHRYPHRLPARLGLHNQFLEAIQTEAGVEHHAGLQILAYEYAALGVLGRVARMN